MQLHGTHRSFCPNKRSNDTTVNVAQVNQIDTDAVNVAQVNRVAACIVYRPVADIIRRYHGSCDQLGRVLKIHSRPEPTLFVAPTERLKSSFHSACFLVSRK